MIEPSRRHGFFDPRFSDKPFGVEHPPAIGLSSSDQALPRLAWAAFSQSRFPHRRRHDFEAQKAYEAYRNRACVTPDQASEPDSLSPVGSV